MKKNVCLLVTLMLVLCAALAMMTSVAWADGETTIPSSKVSVNTYSKTYTGEPITTSVYVYKPGSTYGRLVEGSDYTVTYTNNINVGTATVTVTGIGSYTGTVTNTFEIEPCYISNASFTVGEVYYSEGPLNPTVTATYKGKTLVRGVDFTVQPSRRAYQAS